jgi:hypothetical protein
MSGRREYIESQFRAREFVQLFHVIGGPQVSARITRGSNLALSPK